MTKWRWCIPLSVCVLVLHTPAGTELRIESRHITVFQPVPKTAEGHIASGSRTVVHTGGQKFAVTETTEEINEQLDRCGED